MTRGYSGPVLWATDCELAASETAPSQRRPVAQKRGAAPRRSRAYFPPSPDVLQAGSSGALADGEPDRLYDPALFGTAGDRWAHLVLAEPLIHPWLRYFVATILDLPAEDLWNVSRGFLKLAVTCHDADGRRVLSAVRCLTLAEADASSSPDRAWIQESLGRFMIDFGPSIVLDEIAKRGGARGLAAVELAKARTPLADQVLRVLPLPPPVLRSAPLRASETSATSILARVTHLNARLARLRALAAPSTIVLKDLSYLGEAVDDWLTYGVVLQAHESGLLENLPGALAADLATFTREPPPFPHRPRSTRAPEDADIWANRIGATRRLIEHAVSAADRDPPVWLLRSLALEPAGP
jgi:hypothetical protein